MTFIEKIQSFLNRPFPGPESLAQEIRGMAVASIIVFSFLYLFKPFGLSQYHGSILLVTLGFGAVSFAVGFIYILFFRLVLKLHKDVETWKIKNWIVDQLLLVCFITIGNFLFNNILFGSPFSIPVMIEMLRSTMLVAVFPILFFGLKKQLQFERKHQINAQEISKSISPQTTETSIPSTLLALEAMQNYVNYYHLTNNEIIKETKRITLQNALDELENDSFLRCHRSYVINLNYVSTVSGNAQGLKLELNHSECPVIPVSRSYIQTVKAALKSYS